MSTAKQAQSKKSTRFLLDHEPKIIGGHYAILMGWLEAGKECVAKFDGNASEYARCSLSANVGDGNAKHSTSTIRQFVGVAVTALTMYDTPKQVCDALVSIKDGNRVFPAMGDVREMLGGNGQRAKGTTTKKPVKKVERNKVRKAMRDAGCSDKVIAKVMADLDKK